jgi:hypothetical protein
MTTTRLSDAEIADRLKALDGWARDGQSIKKQYVRGDFPERSLSSRGLAPAPRPRTIILTFRSASSV